MQAVSFRSEPYTDWLQQTLSNPAFYATVELPQFFIVIYDLNKLLFAVFPAHQLYPANDYYQ
jgi:hypothetical protein